MNITFINRSPYMFVLDRQDNLPLIFFLFVKGLMKHLMIYLQVFLQDHLCAQSREDKRFLCTAHYTSEPFKKYNKNSKLTVVLEAF